MIDSIEIPTAILGFRPCLAEIKYCCCWNFDAICHSSRDISISGLGGRIAIFGCRSLSQSFEDTFFDFAVVGKLDFVI